MNIIGTICPVTGHAMNNDQGETCLRIRSRALVGAGAARDEHVWLVGDKHGSFYEAVGTEAEQLEAEWVKLENGETMADELDDL